jgi:hypothetical protein
MCKSLFVCRQNIPGLLDCSSDLRVDVSGCWNDSTGYKRISPSLTGLMMMKLLEQNSSHSSFDPNIDFTLGMREIISEFLSLTNQIRCSLYLIKKNFHGFIIMT